MGTRAHTAAQPHTTRMRTAQNSRKRTTRAAAGLPQPGHPVGLPHAGGGGGAAAVLRVHHDGHLHGVLARSGAARGTGPAAPPHHPA